MQMIEQFSVESPSLSEGTKIVHQVTRFDTLAGVAIKYGVEVADIKRMNGLVTDLQMFAHKKLQIPLPGRHPPSHDLSNGSPSNGYHKPPNRHRRDVLESFQSLELKSQQQKVSPAMSKLQGYYGLAPKIHPIIEGTEMDVYRSTKTRDLEEGTWRRSSPYSEPPLGRHRKSKSYANGFFLESADLNEDVVETKDLLDSDCYQSEKSVRRRQKADMDTPSRNVELLMKEENGTVSSGRPTKSLAPRPKSGNRMDSDSARLLAITLGDSYLANGLSSVRRSSSTSNLQESDSSLLWPATKLRASKGDAVSRPIFDSLPKSLTSRRNKAALD